MGISAVLIPMLGMAIGAMLILNLIFRFLFAPRNNVFFYMFWGSFLLQIPLNILFFIVNYDICGATRILTYNVLLGWVGIVYGFYYFHNR